MAKIVAALGGNALGDTPEEQQQKITAAAKALCALIEAGHELLLVHGNGPQVGKIQLAFDTARGVEPKLPVMPLAECTAMSQGYIGFHLQKGMRARLNEKNIPRPVATVVTEVVVDPMDPAFENPTKPIGSFYSEHEAEAMSDENPGWVFREDAGRGWRRVVASPEPKEILGKESICALMEQGTVVIACGGGGIPVSNGDFESVAAVIDKDFAAALLAKTVGADQLIILTAVEEVNLDWGKPTARPVRRMSIAEAERYIGEGQFAPGSMLPKVQAAMAFAKAGGEAIIASLDRAAEAIRGESGTRIYRPAAGALGGGEAAAFIGGGGQI